MDKRCISLLLILSLGLPVVATADDIPHDDRKEAAGLGIGAVIGGLIAGPPGAIIGAAGGAILGNRDAGREQELARLEKQLQDKQVELAYLQEQFNTVQSRHEDHLRRVKQRDRATMLQQLSDGYSLSIYFRTDSNRIDATLLPHIRELAGLVRNLPAITIILEAHADSRGDHVHNQALSEARADAVRTLLVNAGLEDKRIREHAFGESRARVTEKDREGLIFDRRVDIHLTTDKEA